MTDKTIILNCDHCGVEIEKSSKEYSLECKNVGALALVFCSIECNKAVSLSQPCSYAECFKSSNNQKYPEYIGWYVNASAGNPRRGVKIRQDDYRDAYAEHLFDIWNKQEGKCGFSGVPLIRRHTDGQVFTNDNFRIASIDRIDNSKGYQIGNVHWASLAMNLARNCLGYDEFKYFVRQIMN